MNDLDQDTPTCGRPAAAATRPKRLAGILSLLAAAALLAGLSITPAHAQCTVTECTTNGNDACWETDTGARVIVKGASSGYLPQFSFSFNNGTSYAVRLDRAWETDFDGHEIPRSSVPFASLHWGASIDPGRCELQLSTRQDPFAQFILVLELDSSSFGEEADVGVLIAGYQWVDKTADLNLDLTIRGDPGDKLVLDDATTTASLGDLTLRFGGEAAVKPGKGKASVDLEAYLQTIRLRYGNFGSDSLIHYP